MSFRQLLQQSWVLRVHGALSVCYNYCPPRAWLLLYYPLAHLEVVAYKLLGSQTERRFRGQAIVFLILPLFYFISKTYGLWEVGASMMERCMGEHANHTLSSESTKSRDSDFAVPDQFLDTPVEGGLSKSQVVARQKIYGPNVAWSGKNWSKRIWDFSTDSAHVLSEAALVLGILHYDWMHILLLSALLALEFRAWVQPIQSSDDLADLIALDPSTSAVVIRDGTLAEIAATDLVPGDIVHISEGMVVPVDGRLVSMDDELILDLSKITGDADPACKYEGDLCWASTGVISGSAFLVATSIGRDTFIGRTISLIRGSEAEHNANARNANPHYVADYKMAIRGLGTALMAIIMPVALGQSGALWSTFSPESIMLIVGMWIATIRFSPFSPVKTYRALGSAELLEHGCISQSTEAAESLAGVEILCCDKTGTITGNRLTQLEPVCLSCDPDTLMLTASLCCPPEKDNLDPIERAIMRALKQFPQARASLDRYRVLDFQPFDKESRTIRALVESPGGEQILCVRGAPKALFELCLDQGMEDISVRESYIESARDCARRGHRSLGVARKRENMAWELLGLLPFHDPPRDDTVDALNFATQLSVSFRLITGDAASIAKTFCESIGMDSVDVLDTSSISDALTLTSKEAADIVSARAYADVEGGTKATILEVLQNHGHLVAMTGDGVVEGGWLRQADCGIASDGATEVAQSAADIVFNKPGLWYIVQAIQTSRQIFQQSHNYVVQRTATLLNVLFIMLWHYFVYTEVFSLLLLIFTTQVGDFIVSMSRASGSCLDVPFSAEPVRWSYKRLLREIVPIALTIVLGSLVCMLTLTDEAEYSSSTLARVETPTEAISDFRCQVLTLYVLVTDHLMSCLVHTDGRFWAYPQNLEGLCYVLCFDLTAMLIYHSGWVGQNRQLSMATMFWIWIISLSTFGAAAASRYFTYGGRLIARLKTGEKED